MKAAVTLLASSTFLVPRGVAPKVATELLPVVADPESIAEYDLCDYVVEGLREAARKLRDDLSTEPSVVNLGGCLIIPQMIWLNYQEHGIDHRGALQLPRIAHYSDTMLKTLIGKHAAAHGIECGLELGDVPRSPAANIPLTTPQQPCVGAGARSSMRRGCTSQQSAGFSSEASLSTEKVVQAFKDTMKFEYKRQEEDLDKTMEVIKKKVLEKMRAEACAKRHRDLEASLEFFMGKVKKQATAGSDENRTVGQGLHNEELGAGVGDVAAGTVSQTPELLDMSLTNFWVEPCKSPTTPQGGDEPIDKQMVVDNKGKGPAFHGFYESVYLLTCHNELGRVWYENHKPTPLKLNGYKLKYQCILTGEMFYSGLDAWIRGFNEREKNMMEEVGLPVWRGLVSADVARGGCDFYEWHDDAITDPFLKQLIIDLRDKVWMLEEMNNRLEGIARDAATQVDDLARRVNHCNQGENEAELGIAFARHAVVDPPAPERLRVSTIVMVIALAMFWYMFSKGW
ncbi:hypothetical protein ZWY2020_019403 [Hordeum vulgare]|nr:hypothetical protein ZWY2020_019403 [Hordeum vulgare]